MSRVFALYSGSLDNPIVLEADRLKQYAQSCDSAAVAALLPLSSSANRVSPPRAQESLQCYLVDVI